MVPFELIGLAGFDGQDDSVISQKKYPVYVTDLLDSFLLKEPLNFARVYGVYVGAVHNDHAHWG